MNALERGVYHELLMHQAVEGPFVWDPVRLARQVRLTPEELEAAWPRISACFVQDAQGRWRNVKCYSECCHAEGQRDAGKRRAEHGVRDGKGRFQGRQPALSRVAGGEAGPGTPVQETDTERRTLRVSVSGTSDLFPEPDSPRTPQVGVQGGAGAPRAARSPSGVVGRKPTRITDVPIPDTLDTPGFRAAWATWVEHRRGGRYPLTVPGAVLQLARLSREAPDGDTAARWIEVSIENTWRRVYPPKDEQAGNLGGEQARAERRAQIERLFGT